MRECFHVIAYGPSSTKNQKEEIVLLLPRMSMLVRDTESLIIISQTVLVNKMACAKEPLIQHISHRIKKVFYQQRPLPLKMYTSASERTVNWVTLVSLLVKYLLYSVHQWNIWQKSLKLCDFFDRKGAQSAENVDTTCL